MPSAAACRDSNCARVYAWVTGVRSSWLASVTNRRCRVSASASGDTASRPRTTPVTAAASRPTTSATPSANHRCRRSANWNRRSNTACTTFPSGLTWVRTRYCVESRRTVRSTASRVRRTRCRSASTGKPAGALASGIAPGANSQVHTGGLSRSPRSAP